MDNNKYPREWRSAMAILGGEPNAIFETGYSLAQVPHHEVKQQLADVEQLLADIVQKLTPPEPPPEEPPPEPPPEPTPAVAPMKGPQYVRVADIKMEWDDDTQGWIDK